MSEFIPVLPSVERYYINAGSWCICCGCGKKINGQMCIRIMIGEDDGTTQPTDYCISHYHNLHCLAVSFKLAYDQRINNDIDEGRVA